MIENQGANPGQWEILNSKRGQDVEDALYKLPAFADTFVRYYPEAGGTGETVPVFMHDMPWRWLVCPRGHRVLKVELSVDHNWHLSLSAAPEDTEVTEGWQTVRGASWRPEPRARQVCSKAGCPVIVSTPYCPEHDGDPWGTVVNAIHESRVTIDCPDCSYTGTHLHRHLLVQFALAVAMKRRTMRLTS